MQLRSLVLAVAFLLGQLAVTNLPAADASLASPTYASLSAQAQAAVAEKSWAQARELFLAASKVAPSDEARSWAELGAADATWRAEQPARGDWQAREKWHAQSEVAFERLLAPFAAGRPRDDLWLAIFESRVARKSTDVGAHRAWADNLEIADFLAAAVPTPAAAARYFAFIQRLTPPVADWTTTDIGVRFLAHLRLGIRIAPTADDRAWCARELAAQTAANRLTSNEERALRWNEALVLAAGSRWEARTRAEEFIFASAAPPRPAQAPTRRSIWPGCAANLPPSGPPCWPPLPTLGATQPAKLSISSSAGGPTPRWRLMLRP